MIAFGPVPSRRLGYSLGINNIPAKVCSYGCVYCQVGRTTHMQMERSVFYKPETVFEEVKAKIKNMRNTNQPIDYLTFVPDGEPTLDIHLGNEIDLLKPFNIKIAVITNSSLLWRDDVKNDLLKADWVSVKVDALMAPIWRRIDRPMVSLRLQEVLQGIVDFSKIYKGVLATETMLIRHVNDDAQHIDKIAEFLAEVNPTTAYLSIPTRPPVLNWAESPTEAALNEAYQIFKQYLDPVEYLIGYEGNAFGFTGNFEKDLLGITAVHPLRADAVDELLERDCADWDVVRKLIANHQLIDTEYNGNIFYVRKFS
jgi:wyosine [tRNA(Phe)-imidazoG37] synthetase (radical SAM superfamily)